MDFSSCDGGEDDEHADNRESISPKSNTHMSLLGQGSGHAQPITLWQTKNYITKIETGAQ